MRFVQRRVVRKLGQLRNGRGDPADTNRRNIVITGPGRSGTTLTCHLLSKLPDTIALSEPISPGKYANRLPDREAVCDGIQDFYRDMRTMALERGLVKSKHVGGVVPDNTKGMRNGVRQRVAEKGKISVGKDLSPDFYLAIKQPGMFTALLSDLTERFPCFAIVRNPLAIMASTTTLQETRRRKNPSAKRRYDPELEMLLQKIKKEGADKLDQRLARFHHAFERYQQALPPENVIRYEDICESNGRALSVIVPAASDLDEPLENKNTNPLYKGNDEVLRFGERLLESEGAYWHFYSRKSVEEIMNGLA